MAAVSPGARDCALWASEDMEHIFPFKIFSWALRGSPLASLSHQSAYWQKHLVPPNQCGSWRQSEELSGLPSTSGEPRHLSLVMGIWGRQGGGSS
eukprot:11424367-Ditylum_brightwellii.AAC.1